MSNDDEGTDAPDESEIDEETVPDQEAETEASEEETEAETEGLGEGDFVKLAYTARTVEDDRLVDTTSQEVAEDEGVDEEGQEFEPRVITLGAGHIFEAVEEDISGGAVGDSGSVTVPAAEAFGEYDESEVRTVSADKIGEDDRYPGAHVDIDGQHGHVATIIGGRARVDFNHMLAGEDIEYEYEIVDVVEDRTERARGLLGMFIGDADFDLWIETDEVEEERMVEPDEDAAEGEDEDEEPSEPEFETEVVEKETLYLEAPPQLQFDQQWMFQKNQIAQQLMDRLDLDRVIVQETIDGSGGMFGGMGGMMGGMGGGGGEELEDLEAELADADVDADEIVEELEADAEAGTE